MLPTPIGITIIPWARKSCDIAEKLPLSIPLTKQSRIFLEFPLLLANKLLLMVSIAAEMLSDGWFRVEMLSIAVETAEKL